ncbi:MAG TPA: CGNR zinc finger domain-containing protein [Gaiellaceae bacterium]|nr:CGNR zinc finger domain-containing protein [Gaiellaceae bacterium]
MVSPPTSYSRLVDGLELPLPLAGHPALELCNTRAGWGEPEPKEYLGSTEHLAVLARACGLVSQAELDGLRGLEAEPDVLRRTLAFREALYEVCLDPRPGPAWDAVAAEAERAACAASLRPDGWALPLDPELPLLAFARAAGELLASPHVPIRRCPGHGCGWLFLDPRGRRRWCTMATCGNRAKARRHAARARSSRGA